MRGGGFVESSELVALCSALLREVKHVRSSQKTDLSGYEDVTIGQSPLSTCSVAPGVVGNRIVPSFLRSLAGALNHGARDGSGLFEAKQASVALVSVIEALSRMLVNNAEGQDLAGRTAGLNQGLVAAMASGNKEAVSWAAMAMSQISLRRPETAISM